MLSCDKKTVHFHFFPVTIQVCSIYQWQRNGTTAARAGVLILYQITVFIAKR